MGLLDKAAKLASTAKGQFDELRDTRDAAAVRPVAAQQLDEHEHGVLRRAMAHGAPDPDALLSRAEASHVVGVELGEPRLTYSDQSVGLEFAAQGRKPNQRWSVEVSAWHGDEDGYDPVATYKWLGEHVEGETFDDLGQRSVYDGSRLYVLAEPLLFHVEIRTPEPDDATRRTQTIAVAQRVLARLQG
jgi:hypothetical protein